MKSAPEPCTALSDLLIAIGVEAMHRGDVVALVHIVITREKVD
ncbi:hypothetical protein [Microbacterium sp.]|nr:hypothetical protein [Microbacterium sp.]